MRPTQRTWSPPPPAGHSSKASGLWTTAHGAGLLRHVRALGAADRHERRLATVRGVEVAVVAVARAVQRVDHRRAHAVGHRQRGVARVVVQDVERATVRLGGVERGEGARDVVGLPAAPLDLVGVRVVQQRLHVGLGRRRRRREQGDVVPVRRRGRRTGAAPPPRSRRRPGPGPGSTAVRGWRCAGRPCRGAPQQTTHHIAGCRRCDARGAGQTDRSMSPESLPTTPVTEAAAGDGQPLRRGGAQGGAGLRRDAARRHAARGRRPPARAVPRRLPLPVRPRAARRRRAAAAARGLGGDGREGDPRAHEPRPRAARRPACCRSRRCRCASSGG